MDIARSLFLFFHLIRYRINFPRIMDWILTRMTFKSNPTQTTQKKENDKEQYYVRIIYFLLIPDHLSIAIMNHGLSYLVNHELWECQSSSNFQCSNRLAVLFFSIKFMTLTLTYELGECPAPFRGLSCRPSFLINKLNLIG